MKEKLVSVLTPVYNGERYIARLLDSILNQTYPDIEMILSDDGSTDDTVEIASAYIPKFEGKGYTLKIILSPHKNASAAMNAGFYHVNGEYLIWPDSDDELFPDSVATRVNFLNLHPEYHCVRSLMEYVSNETGETIQCEESLGDLTKEDIFWDVLEWRTFCCSGCYMLKTEDFFQIYPSKRIPESIIGQNFQMLLPFLYHYKCPTIPEKLYRVYVRSDSHSRKMWTKAEEWRGVQRHVEVVNEIMQICGIEKNPDIIDRVKLWGLRQKRSTARTHGDFVMLYGCKIMMAYIQLKRRLRRKRKISDLEEKGDNGSHVF